MDAYIVIGVMILMIVAFVMNENPNPPAMLGRME